MKNKKMVYASISIVLLVTALAIFMPFLLKKDVSEIVMASEIETSEWFQDRVQKYEIIQCKFGLKRSAYGFIYENKFKNNIDYHIQFYELNRSSIFSQAFQAAYDGGTTIKNTTFPEFVKMVKEDCGQFQEGHGDYFGEEMAWSYSPYEPELKKTQEELEFEQRMEEWQEIQYQESVERGEVETFDTMEKALRASGMNEDAIKKALEEDGESYVGP